MWGILDFSAKCFVGCGLAFAMIGPCSSAHANGAETVFHSFCSRSDCRDGENPMAGLIMDRSGNIYGTTSTGGANRGGNVFEIAPDGTYKLLYSFCSETNCTDGSSPNGSLVMDKSGKLYGTTFDGGTGNCFGNANCGGTVFSINPKTGAETVLHSFCSRRNCNDGDNPAAGVIMDGSGNIYGTTEYSGALGYGNVFKLATNGAEKVLHSFGDSNNDGFNPATGLILDSAGNLYGTTQFGGTNGLGNVFEVTPDRTFNLLYSFCSQEPNCSDGDIPVGGLVMDSSGNLYGTAQHGGVNDYGTVFELATNGTETVLYDLCSKHDCSDGASPVGSLTMDGSGNLYGTTQYGVGRDCHDYYTDECGAVFKLAANGTETTLYSFCSKANCADGLEPEGSLIMDGSGKLYGTTFRGGTGHCEDGCGTIFRLDPGRKETK